MKCVCEPLNLPLTTPVCVQYGVLKALWLSIQDFWDLLLYCWACGFWVLKDHGAFFFKGQSFFWPLALRNGGSTVLWIVRNHLLNTASHPRRHEYLTTSCCACRTQFSHLGGGVDSARCKAPSSLAACFRSSGWPPSLHALLSASLVGHCTWRNDGTAWEQHFVSLLPRHQLQVKVLGIILIEGALYLICNWSPGSSITRM